MKYKLKNRPSERKAVSKYKKLIRRIPPSILERGGWSLNIPRGKCKTN
jgi:hypothetical protein